MASLTLKDIPRALLDRLRAAADEDGRSVTEEALQLIQAGLARRADAEDRARRQLEAWRALAGSWESDESFEDEVRAIYSSRG